MTANSFSEPTLMDKMLSFLLVLLTLVVLVFSGFYVLPEYGIFWFILIVIAVMFLLVKWHSSTRGYLCANCGHEFTITFWQDLPTTSSILFMKKMLKCPSCAYKDYANEVVKKISR